MISAAIGVLVVGALGFAAGIHHERVEWNKLIRKGHLPEPGERWTYK